jgi:hypothetical protein
MAPRADRAVSLPMAKQTPCTAGLVCSFSSMPSGEHMGTGRALSESRHLGDHASQRSTNWSIQGWLKICHRRAVSPAASYHIDYFGAQCPARYVPSFACPPRTQCSPLRHHVWVAAGRLSEIGAGSTPTRPAGVAAIAGRPTMRLRAPINASKKPRTVLIKNFAIRSAPHPLSPAKYMGRTKIYQKFMEGFCRPRKPDAADEQGLRASGRARSRRDGCLVGGTRPHTAGLRWRD